MKFYCFRTLSKAQGNFVPKDSPIGFQITEKNAKTQTHTQTHTHFRIYISRDSCLFIYTERSLMLLFTTILDDQKVNITLQTKHHECQHRISPILHMPPRENLNPASEFPKTNPAGSFSTKTTSN